jgi:diguanylate cyclase (GGDEF)-like protein/PAS domain S-box-containing protein
LPSIFHNLSLKLKVTFFTLGLFLLAIGVVTYQFSIHIRDELTTSLSGNQLSEVSFVAEHIDSAIKLRIESLSLIARSVTPALMEHRDQLSSFLAMQHSIDKLYTLGVIVISKEGNSIADFPSIEGRRNADFTQIDFYRHVLATKKPVISQPALGRFANEAQVVIGVPIFDKFQNIAGVLAGVISLNDDSLLSTFDKHPHPNTSSYTVISPRDNIIVAATEKNRILKTLPVSGADKMHDRYMNGFEGSGIAVNSLGIEELSSAKKVNSSGWVVVGSMQSDQAFERITHIRDEAIIVASIVSLFFIMLIWLFLRHELSPLERSGKRILELADNNERGLLPLEGSPEIRQIQSSFNQLQSRIGHDEVLLRDNEALYHAMFDNNTAIKWLIDLASGAIVDANPAAAKFYGWPIERLRQMNITEINTLPGDLIRKEMALAAAEKRKFFRFKHRLSSGELRDVEVHSAQVNFRGKALLYSIITDVTERELVLRREKSRSNVLESLAHGRPTADILHDIILMIEAEQPETACAIFQVSKEGKHLLLCAAPNLPATFHTVLQEIEIGTDKVPCSRAAARGERAIIADIQAQPLPPEFKKLARQANLASCWAEPILSSSNEALGILSVYRNCTGEPSTAQIKLLEQMCQLVSITLERKRDDESLRLSSSVFQTSADAIAITDENNRIIAVNPAFTQITQYSQEEVLGQNPKILSSGNQSADFYKTMWQSITTLGKWQGEILNRRKDGEVYSEWLSISTVSDENKKVQQRIAIFSDISEIKRTEAIIWHQANYDTLTGLPNRRLFHDRLSHELKKSERDHIPLALMFIDLDHFKEINDTLGHEAGDFLLQESASRITKCVRDTDTVARLGGDEFTVVLPKLTDTERLENIAGSIISALATPFHIGDLPVYVSASIGITIFPNDANDISSLLKNADQAMYVAKSKGRNQFSYFTSSMQESAHMRLQLSNDLRGALDAGQLEVYYQPIIQLATGHVSKAEALIRWHHPTLGMVSPSIFIPLAEDIGLISAIGDWVFRQSAMQALTWHLNKSDHLQHIQISVNKSPRQFGANNLNLEVIEWLHKLSLPPACIVMEITEGLLMDDRTEVKDTLLAYRDAGIQVSLDDFGTGYSAMSYLQRFDIDYIKIDQSFVRNMVNNVGDQAIVEAIIVMAHKLGMKVIAEGVETAQQRDMLAAAGCDYGQGYLFARPMPSGQFEEFLAQFNNIIG